MLSIIIGADIVPVEKNIHIFESGDAEKLVDKRLSEELKNADYRVFNLEVPLTDELNPIKKCGPNLIAPVKTVNGIKALNPDLLTLANNHIMDQGEQGLYSTVKTLSENGISYVGVGNSIFDAQKPYIADIEGARVGFYACCEHEFSVAGEKKPGANPYEPLDSFDHIEQLKQKCDYVIVLYHGGKEHYRYPSPYLRRVCEKMCRVGADLVVCQHTHCVGSMEYFGGSAAVYGQGNFHFNEHSNEFWDTAILLKLSFDNGMKIEFIPLKQDGLGVSCGDEKTVEEFLERSEKIKQPGFIENEYRKFAENMAQNYAMRIKPPSFLFRVINKLCGHRLKYKLSEKHMLSVRNIAECEAHRELIIKNIDQRTRTNGFKINI